MGKNEPFSRGQLRSQFRTWMCRNRRMLTLITLGQVALIGFVTWVLAMVGLPGYALGLIHGLFLAAWLAAIGQMFLAHDKTAIWHVRGAWGEDNTRSELTRAKRRRLIWGAVHAVPLQIGDIDHVVVTRRGGIVVIDSKWRSDEALDDAATMAQAALAAQRRLEGVIASRLKEPAESRRAGRRRAVSKACRVTPLIVIWGAAQAAVGQTCTIDGVDVVRGRDLVRWLQDLDGDRVDKFAASNLIGELESFRDGVRDHQKVAAT